MIISGCTALVTGAGSGIGEATALRLAREDAALVVDDVDRAAGEATVRRIEAAGGRAAFVRADVASEDDVRHMIAFAEETFGGLAILVNNAGAYVEPPYFPDADPSRWSRIMDVYLRGTMLCTQYAIAAMRRRGGGAIVNIASGAGVGYAAGGVPEYAAAKAGVVRLTAVLGALRATAGIRVNCICPGWVNTPMTRRTLAERSPEELPGPRPTVMVEPEDVANAVVDLVRDDALAGRVMLLFEGEPPRLLPIDAT